MKKIVYLASALLIIGCSGTKNAASSKSEKKNSKIDKVDPTTYANSISEKDLREMLFVYAGDEFQGRNTGDRGQKMAVDFLVNKYKTLGISAAQANGSYIQKVPLMTFSLPEGAMELNGNVYQIGTDLITFGSFETKKYEFSDVVFMGYGIDAEEYSDYTSNINVKNKIVFIKSGEPKNSDGIYKITKTTEPSKWSDFGNAFRDKVKIAKDKGAAGIFVYDPDNFEKIVSQYAFMSGRKSDNISIKSDEEDFMYFFVSEAVATSIVEGINEPTLPAPAKMPVKMEIAISSNSEEVDSENVAAIIRGSETPDEYLVISAHLDHVGMDNEGNVFNGADDDGSGTTAVLEIAEAFKKALDDGYRPKRSIVFLHVTGEEKGLLGSEYYSEHPIFPMEQTVADLNIDMVGRIDPKRKGNREYVYLIGSDKLSTELHNLSEEVNKKYTNIELDYTYNDDNDPNRFYYRSDHYNFAKHNVPIIFYFNGTHDDYHKITDTPDKINYDLLALRAKLVFYTAWKVANLDHRIIADKAVTE